MEVSSERTFWDLSVGFEQESKKMDIKIEKAKRFFFIVLGKEYHKLYVLSN
jgi:hypothetical protein